MVNEIRPQMPVESMTAMLAGKLPRLEETARKDPAAAKLVEAAKGFESVLIQRLLEEMKRTIPDSALDESGAGEQTMDLFWMHLGQHIASNGGLGLWKELARNIGTTGGTPVVRGSGARE